MMPGDLISDIKKRLTASVSGAATQGYPEPELYCGETNPGDYQTAYAFRLQTADPKALSEAICRKFNDPVAPHSGVTAESQNGYLNFTVSAGTLAEYIQSAAALWTPAARRLEETSEQQAVYRKIDTLPAYCLNRIRTGFRYLWTSPAAFQSLSEEKRTAATAQAVEGDIRLRRLCAAILFLFYQQKSASGQNPEAFLSWTAKQFYAYDRSLCGTQIPVDIYRACGALFYFVPNSLSPASPSPGTI